MYVNSAFKTPDEDAWTFVVERGFGTVVAIEEGRPVAAQVPLMVAGEAQSRRIEFHVARVNPLHDIITKNPNVLVTVSGPDAYVSPDWYVSANQVPTWNYIAAHINGRAKPMDRDRAHDHVERMSLAFERQLLPKKPWSTTKMTPERLAMMLTAIVPIEIEVEGIECSFKLGQNKSEPDRMEVARMLDWRGGPGERGIAAAMRRKLRSAATPSLSPSPSPPNVEKA